MQSHPGAHLRVRPVSTKLILVRHGVSADTTAKRFSGGLDGSNPPLASAGEAQINAAMEFIGEVDVIVSSPVRRARQSADLLAARVGLPVLEEPGLAEMSFGSWEGREMAEVMKTDPEGFMGFFSSVDQVAGATGESLIEVQARVRRACADVVAAHEGKRVAVFSHVTPIKVIVADALGAPLLSVYRSQLDPGGVSLIEFGKRGQRVLGFNLRYVG